MATAQANILQRFTVEAKVESEAVSTVLDFEDKREYKPIFRLEDIDDSGNIIEDEGYTPEAINTTDTVDTPVYPQVAEDGTQFIVKGSGTNMKRKKMAMRRPKPHFTIVMWPNDGTQQFKPTRIPLSREDSVKVQRINQEYKTTVHNTKMCGGKPTTRLMRQLARLNGVIRMVSFDTKIDLNSLIAQDKLNIYCGFNTKSIAILNASTGFGIVQNDLVVPFGLTSTGGYINSNTPNLDNQKAYGQLLNTFEKITLMNVNPEFPINVKVSLVSIDSTDFPVPNNFAGTGANACWDADFGSWLDDTQTITGAVPKLLQMSPGNTLTSDNIQQCEFRLGTRIESASNFREHFKRVASVTKVLGPQDVWFFNYEQMYGKGIDLFAMGGFEVALPYDHFFMIETWGPQTQCEWVPPGTGTAGTNVTVTAGSAPGVIKVNYSKGTTFVRRPFWGNLAGAAQNENSQTYIATNSPSVDAGTASTTQDPSYGYNYADGMIVTRTTNIRARPMYAAYSQVVNTALASTVTLNPVFPIAAAPVLEQRTKTYVTTYKETT